MNRMSYFNGKVLFVGLGLTYLFKLSTTSFYISIILGSILGLIILRYIRHNNQIKLFNMLNLSLLIIMLVSLFTNLSHSLYLDDTEEIVIIIFIFISTFILSLIRESSFKRISINLFKCSIIMVILMTLSLIPYIDLSNLIPLNMDIKNILFSSIIYAFTSLYPIIMLNNLSDKKTLQKNYIVSNIVVFIGSFLIVTVLGINETLLYRYPEYIILKRIRMLNFISNVDNIFSFLLIIDLTMSISKSIKMLSPNIIVRLIVCIICLIFVSIISYNYIYIDLIFKYYPYIITILFILGSIPLKSSSENDKTYEYDKMEYEG